MKSGSSAFIGSASHLSEAVAISSWYQTSRPSTISQGSSHRLTMMDFSMVGVARRASSAIFFSGTFLLARFETFAVMRILQSESLNAVLEGVGAEAAEHDRVDGANAGAGHHRDRQFQNHAQIYANAVALLHAERPSARWRTCRLQRAVPCR